MPEGIEPALALVKARPPSGSDWTDEVKFDGYRLAVHIEPSGVRILIGRYLFLKSKSESIVAALAA